MTSAPEIISAVPPHFAADGKLDLPALRTNLERLEPVLDGVFVAGTTGEFPALADDERIAVIEEAISVFGPARVVAHIGAAATHSALALARAALEVGAQRLAAVTPYYLRASTDGVRRHYAALREVVEDGELYGYLFPDVALTDVTPAELPGLVAAGLDGVKVSGTASTRVADYLAKAPAGFKLWSGNDADLPNVLARGGRGLVSGVSAVLPEPWVAFRAAYAADDRSGVDRAQRAIEALVSVLGPSITRLKYGLSVLGLPSGPTRMCVDEPTAEVRTSIEAALAQARSILA
jgi:4-hydroxy-tetrahydrodipicolinate synthase